MTNYRKQGSAQLIKKLRTAMIKDSGVTPAYVEIATILSERNKLNDDIRAYFLGDEGQVEQPKSDQELATEAINEVLQQPGMVELLDKILNDKDEDEDEEEVYEPHLESAIHNKEDEDDEPVVFAGGPKNTLNPDPNEETEVVAKPKKARRRNRSVSPRVRYENNREIAVGDNVRFYSAKDEETVEGVVIGTTTGTRDNHPYFKIQYTAGDDPKLQKTVKRDYACLLIVEGQPAGKLISGEEK